MSTAKEIELLEKLVAEKKKQAAQEKERNLVGNILDIRGIKFKITKHCQKNKNKDGTLREYYQIYARGFHKGKNYKIHLGKDITAVEEAKEKISVYLEKTNV